MIYLDTSWLVKLYVSEPDTAAVSRAVVRHESVVVSELSYVETRSALERLRRESVLDAKSVAAIVAKFGRDWANRDRLDVSREVVAHAAELVTRHPLRSLDAIHLASALLVDARSPQRVEFGSADARLAAAALAEGLPVALASLR